MAATAAPRLTLTADPDIEVDYLIQQLSALETLTELGGPETTVQLTANELHGMFHVLKVQAQRIETAIELAG